MAAVADIHRSIEVLIEVLKELGVVLFCLLCTFLVLTEILIRKVFHVLRLFQRERHAYSTLKAGSRLGRKKS